MRTQPNATDCVAYRRDTFRTGDRSGLRNHISTARTVKLSSDAFSWSKLAFSIPQEETGQEKSAIRLRRHLDMWSACRHSGAVWKNTFRKFTNKFSSSIHDAGRHSRRLDVLPKRSEPSS